MEMHEALVASDVAFNMYEDEAVEQELRELVHQS